jgi:hypothetical protein
MGSDLALRQQVEALHRQATASDQEFCIDLEGEAPDGRPVWDWAELSRVDSARRSVTGKKQLIEGEHYLLHRSVVQVPHQGGLRSTESVRIVFTVEGFELWLLMLDTPRGHQIRQFFRECHKRLQLGMSQLTALNQVTDNLAQLSGLVIGGFSGVRAELGEVKAEQVAMRQDIDCLKRQHHKRKPAPTKHRRIYEQTVQQHYGGACPCCHRHRLPLQEEHWYDRSLNGIDQMWLVCRECNDDLGVAGSPNRSAKKRQFDAFQGFVHFHSIGMQIELL